MPTDNLFVVTFEHAHRAFRCVRLDGAAGEETPTGNAHWIVTLEGRTVYSFPARADDTRERVQETVTGWWDAARR